MELSNSPLCSKLAAAAVLGCLALLSPTPLAAESPPTDTSTSAQASDDTDESGEESSDDGGGTAAGDDAEEEETSLQFVTDRPGFSSSTYIVPTGHAQLEGGTQIGRSGGLNLDTLTLLGRFGFTEWFELRLGTSAFQFENLDGDTSFQWLDSANIAAKFGTRLNENIRVGVLPFVELANITNTNAPGVSAGATALVDLESEGPVGLSFNIGAANVDIPGTDERGFEFSGSTVAGITITDRIGTYAEFYMIAAPEADPEFFGETGVTFGVTEVFQLDAYGGLELADNEAWYVGLGASYLL